MWRVMLTVVSAAGWAAPVAAAAWLAPQEPAPVITHDNTEAAGVLRDGVLHVSLRAGTGRWRPEGNRGPTLDVHAFGVEGGPLAIPSPLIRVQAGTVVEVTIWNTLSSALRVHGLCDRPGPCTPADVAPGARGRFRFTLHQPGTFHYWASARGAPLLQLRSGAETQLGGAIVVDESGEERNDRVLVMGLMKVPGADSTRDVTVINGRSWPDTERLRYAPGDTARWRLLNITATPHAMHLHGFFFDVISKGNGVRDSIFGPAGQRSVVTEQLEPGGTFALVWAPTRPGNWLFHCHMLGHMMAHGAEHDMAAADTAGAAGMAGLVMGVEVSGDAVVATDTRPRRALRLIIEPDTRLGATPSYRVELVADRPMPRINERPAPGPIMVLTRDEPVAVEVVNRTSQPTTIHWHGIELESYDDGVVGFGGRGARRTPAVPPGGSFTARFTPPRAGTFMYHTHWEDPGQLSGGIYGPIVVLEPGETYDPRTDHIIVVGLEGRYRINPNEPFAVNGEAPPRPLVLAAGVPNRLRFINITADNVALTVQLLSRFDPIEWTPLAKDGAAISLTARTPRSARQLVGVGEIHDFEVPAMQPRPGLWMELRRGSGEIVFQWPVQVR